MAKTFNKGNMASSDKNYSPKPSGEIPPPQVPMAVARLFVAQHCMHAGTLTLRHWRGGWWQWQKHIGLSLRSARFAACSTPSPSTPSTSRKKTSALGTNPPKIGDLLEALAVICIQPTDLDQPAGSTAGPQASSSPLATVSSISNSVVRSHIRRCSSTRHPFLSTISRTLPNPDPGSRSSRRFGPPSPRPSTFSASGSAMSSAAEPTCTRFC